MFQSENNRNKQAGSLMQYSHVLLWPNTAQLWVSWAHLIRALIQSSGPPDLDLTGWLFRLP